MFHFYVLKAMGIGGGVIMTVYIRKERKAFSIVARESAPAASYANMFFHQSYDKFLLSPSRTGSFSTVLEQSIPLEKILSLYKFLGICKPGYFWGFFFERIPLWLQFWAPVFQGSAWWLGSRHWKQHTTSVPIQLHAWICMASLAGQVRDCLSESQNYSQVV